GWEDHEPVLDALANAQTVFVGHLRKGLIADYTKKDLECATEKLSCLGIAALLEIQKQAGNRACANPVPLIGSGLAQDDGFDFVARAHDATGTALPRPRLCRVGAFGELEPARSAPALPGP